MLNNVAISYLCAWVLNYIHSSDLPSLRNELINHLEAPISDLELQAAIKDNQAGKALFLNGSTIHYYKALPVVLSPNLLTSLNALASRSPLGVLEP